MIQMGFAMGRGFWIKIAVGTENWERISRNGEIGV
jgi:hypothetical protein